MLRWVKCSCGQTDGHDDKIIHQELISVDFNAAECVIRETRVCDICRKSYQVDMHYKHAWEEPVSEETE